MKTTLGKGIVNIADPSNRTLVNNEVEAVLEFYKAINTGNFETHESTDIQIIIEAIQDSIYLATSEPKKPETIKEKFTTISFIRNIEITLGHLTKFCNMILTHIDCMDISQEEKNEKIREILADEKTTIGFGLLAYASKDSIELAFRILSTDSTSKILDPSFFKIHGNSVFLSELGIQVLSQIPSNQKSYSGCPAIHAKTKQGTKSVAIEFTKWIFSILSKYWKPFRT